jgi:hypothetical protein
LNIAISLSKLNSTHLYGKGRAMSRFLLVPFLCALMFASLTNAGDLRTSFVDPPESARPWVYWVWMDGNLNEHGITADLEAMKRAGIGGVIIMEVNVGIPRGNVDFLSPAWRRLFKHVVSEAKRIGIQITLISGPGWTGTGGPWITPKTSMHHLVGSALDVTGPALLDSILPRPERRPAFFGDGALPPVQEEAKNSFYEDVTVLAFPTPESNERITDIDEKALYVRAPYSSQPGVRPFLPPPDDRTPLPQSATVPVQKVVDLSGQLKAGGRLQWSVPEGKWTIMRFGRTSTGANTRPAPAPGFGLECDKLDTSALNLHFETFIGALLKEVGQHKSSGQGGWTTLHIDSWEMGAQNWTDNFRQEFRRRRGYDMYPYLPAYAGRVIGSLEVTERFLWDLRQTANELLLENHAGHLKELGRRHGFDLSIEPYDMTPCADMSLGAIADVPMCEFWLYGFNTSYSVIEATSIAHSGGKSIVAAESFTSSDEERWFAHPESMKPLGDWAFASGVNRFVFHRYQHQPLSDLRPGMTMGPYGVHWERTQTWWELSSGYHKYLSRCQFLLRQGLPVADVCFLVAEGAPHVFRPPSGAVRGNPPDRLGYNFDGCAPDVFMSRASVSGGDIVMPDGMKYKVLVLPDREPMTPALLKKVKGLIADGATVIGPPPRKSPSLAGYPACDTDVQGMAKEVWGDCDGVAVTEHRYGKGRVVWVKSQPASQPAVREPDQYGDFKIVMHALEEMGIPPDFESTIPLRYTHRRLADKEMYFVANPFDSSIVVECTFRVKGKVAQVWDAVYGTMRNLPHLREKDSRTTVTMKFEPHQSFFVVFSSPSRAVKTGGGTPAELEEVVSLQGVWKVSFDPHWGGPEEITFASLDDWSARKEEGIKYYSGIATYRKEIELPKELLGSSKKREVWLDLGSVKNLARVRLNGQEVGVLWCSPWRIDIGGAVKSGKNTLEIEVANLWPNRLIGDARFVEDAEYGKDGNLLRWPEWVNGKTPRPPTGRYAFATWSHFKKDSPLLPSGLLGPVRILAGGSKRENR